MPRVLLSRRLQLTLGVALPFAVALTLSACGGSDQPAATVESGVGKTAAERAPAAAPASDLLGRLADVPDSRGRLAYVNEEALAALDLTLSPGAIRTAVLGAAGAERSANAGDDVRLVAQLGPTTVLAQRDGTRTIIGASADVAGELASTTPPVSVLAPETASAVQSCLGDPAAEVIRGSDVLGPTSGLGVSLLDSPDQPAGPKLHVCAAPHYVRELHVIEKRLKARFPQGIVAGEEIGEREIVAAKVPVSSLTSAELRALLSGGPALLGLAQG